jgi:RimJ/RimL family protein N-acetyltransferase
LNDADFIAELVNTQGWLEFIGDRNIRTEEDARKYIQKIMDNPNIRYWIVQLADQKTSIGIITFIKRDYLEHHDIGFAFLPEFTGKGYAHEATMVVLNDIIKDPVHTQILATTVRNNINSIRLLEKLGLTFQNELQIGKDSLLIYAVSADKLAINQVSSQ